jgi:glycosyltransferase involved in cell wall biosynthesis
VKILHVIASVDPVDGGPIEGIIQQCQSLADHNVREIVCLDPPDAPFLTYFPIRTHALGTKRYKPGPRSKIARFGYTGYLVPWLRANARRYDIIVINGLWNYASVGASLILPSLNVPYVVYPHGMMDPWFRRTYPLKHWLKQLFWILFEGRLVRHARALLFTSEDEMVQANGQFHGHPYRALVVGYGTGDAPSGAQAQIEAFRAALPGLGARRYLLFLGRIHPKKGCDLLIHGWAAVAKQHPDLQLVIAGPDQTGWQRELRILAERLGVDASIHWPGMISGPAKWGAFRAAEAFVLPSHQENFGVAVAEALACGTPVLISDKVNIWREVKACGAGLVEKDSLTGTRRLLQNFMALDEPSQQRMRVAARQCFIEHFDLKHGAQNALALFRDLARGAA